MMRKISSVLLFCLAGCGSGDRYDVNRYYDAREQDEVLTQIVTFIFEAPPYTQMKDRFESRHRGFYSKAAAKFSILKYYVSPEGLHYFYVMRPGPNAGEKRGVGGYYRIDSENNIYGFREAFVTPLMPEIDVKERCSFLFDEMVKGDLERYLKMETYVQWPNRISAYDTVTYEWKLKEGYDAAK